MNILKAFLITFLLIAFEVLLSLGIYPLIEKIEPIENAITYNKIANVLFTIISYAIIFLLFKVNLNWKNTLPKINTIELNTIFYLLIITIGLEFFDRPLFDFTKIIDTFNNNPIEPYVHFELSNSHIIFKGISGLIIAPVLEELLFRKYMFTNLLKKYSLNWSIIISSLFFSLIHIPSYRNLIPTFIFGIICCIVYLKTKNILYTIILHFFANLTWLSLLVYGEKFYEWIYELNYDFMYWSLFVFGILMTILGMKKIKTTANNVYN
jgi:membrane protease YdiL (CAAX protease family)